MTRTTRILIRLTTEEKANLAELAKKSGLSLSEYIRIRVGEQINEPISDYRAEMTTLGMIAYYTLGKIARKQLSEEEIIDARTKANQALAKWKINTEG